MTKHFLSRLLANLPGWRTKRKIVVIESDDWGSIRMPSKEVYMRCLKAGYPVDKTAYERYDSLLSSDDLELLFDLLTSYKDNNGNHPIITGNCVVANPDFHKIKQSNFENYYFELITETFKKYPRHSNNFILWQEGIKNNIFFPQFHAREHLNVSLFMEALRKGDRDVHFGFENKMPGSINIGPLVKGNIYVTATQFRSIEDKNQKLQIYLEGLELFTKLFGYKSETIIPPNYTWSSDFDEAVFRKGVRCFQGIRKIHEPVHGKSPKYHTVYLGKMNKFGQTYLVRNSFFEPSVLKLDIKDPVSTCLSEMDISFRLFKPAIISSHRINYVGFIDKANRDRTLKMLHQILKAMLKNWPEIEFMTSPQLSRLINNLSFAND